jgi:addiction module RelE/StbE family toxin
VNIDLHPDFKKAYKKRVANLSSLARKTEERIALFKQNQSHPILKDHRLVGKLGQYRAFSVTGNIRVVYQRLSPDNVVFMDIGTHNQVY